MVKPIQRNEIHGFSKGLITDLNPLTGQVDTTIDEVNFELHDNGTRSRRLGLTEEVSSAPLNTGQPWNRLSFFRVSSFLWEGADGNPDNKFVVLRMGNHLYFYHGNGPDGSSRAFWDMTLPVAEDANISFGAVEGYLGVTTGTPFIYLISYNPDDPSLTLEPFRIKIRDLFGIENTIDNRFEIDKDYRGPLNWQHYYNLYNQGWAIPRKDWLHFNPAPLDTVFLGANKNVGNAPANGDVVWSGLAHKPFMPDSLENYEAFHYAQFEGARGADTQIGKGFFIIDAFNRGSSRAEAWINHRNKYPQTGGLVPGFGPKGDTTSGGPTSVASHAGRLFYSGCRGSVIDGDARSPNYNNYVFFTQLIKSKQDFSKCYQEGDPTSRDSSDLLDTDGGFFVVSEAINIHTMYSMGDKLFLLAENGVWAVSGGSGYGFAATNYMVTKLSTYGGVPNKSFVEFGGNGYFWGWDGIYSIQKNQFGDYEVSNVTKGALDGFYNSISDEARVTCQGFVDKMRRQIRWVYTEGAPFEEGSVSKELVLDLKFQAFYPFTINPHPANMAYLVSGVQFGEFSIRYEEQRVVVGSDTVIAGSDNVVTDIGYKTAIDSNVKYMTVRNQGGQITLTVCKYRDVNYQDWSWLGTPVDAYAYMETHPFTGGDFAINKQVPYLTMAFAETEKAINPVTDQLDQESSCIGTFKWNFSELARTGQWSRPIQLYRKSRFFYGDVDIYSGYSLNITKTKIRGRGKAFSLRVETEPLKECHIYGWNLSLTANGVT